MKTYLLLIFAVLVMAACEDTIQRSELSKEEAASRTDGVDYCSVYAWYGDGVCDRFCATRDPDCDLLQPQPQPQPEPLPEPLPEPQCLAEDCACPRFTDEVVTYFSRNSEVCMQDEISQVCPQGTTNFFIEECGCGCIGTPLVCEDTEQKDYVGYGDECLLLDWDCFDTNAVPFEDDCGCGCQTLPDRCQRMDVVANGPCDAELGTMFTGLECVTISGCSCSGLDCDKLFASIEECETSCQN